MALKAIEYLEKLKDSVSNAKYIDDVAHAFEDGRRKGQEEKQKEIPMPDSTQLIEWWDEEEAMLKEKDFRDDTWRIAQNAFMDGVFYGWRIKQKKPENTSASTMIPSCWEEKQQEQKPAEGKYYSSPDCGTTTGVLSEDEDERIRQVFVDFIESYLFWETDGLSKEKALAWLEKQKEQKPAARSVEDDHIIGFVYDILNEIIWRDEWAMSKNECLQRLNDYRPQQKAEWTEGDEKMLNGIIQVVAGVGIQKNGEREKQINWLKDRLKSFRPQPHWKPSEKQMEALQTMYEYCPTAVSPQLIAISDNLRRLYNDLKKLKEE